MKTILLILSIGVLHIAASAQTGYITNLQPTQFKTAFENDKNARLIDVRQDWEFKKGHIEKAVNIDVMSDTFEAEVSKISRTTPIYVYCYSGGRSTEAAEKLKELGFKKIVNLSGGISAWEKALLPVQK